MIKAEKTKSDRQFIKELPLKNAIGTHGNVFLVWKQKKSGLVSVYVRKMLRADDKPESAYLEAIAGDFYRYMNNNITPKVRVVANEQQITAVISKQIKGYQEANSLSPKKLSEILSKKNNIRQLACLLVSCYFYAEDDLHDENWGLDNQDNIVKIDNDRTFMPLSSQYIGFDPSHYSQSIEVVSRWPNTIFSPKERWSNMTISDLESLPKLIDARSTSWPKRLHKIINNKEFKYWKYYYITRALVLQDEMMQSIMHAHSPDAMLSESLLMFLKNRQKQLQNLIISLPDYRAFVINNIATINHEFIKENKAYNAAFIKKKQMHRIINRNQQAIDLDLLYQKCLELEEEPKKAKYKELILRHAGSQAREESCKIAYQRLTSLRKLYPSAWDIKLQLKQTETITIENQVELKQIQSQLEELTRSNLKQSQSSRALFTQLYAQEKSPKAYLSALCQQEALMAILQDKVRLEKIIQQASQYYTNPKHISPIYRLFDLSIHYQVYDLSELLIKHLEKINAADLLKTIAAHRKELSLYQRQNRNNTALSLLVESFNLFLNNNTLQRVTSGKNIHRDLVLQVKDYLIDGQLHLADKLIEKYRPDSTPSLSLV